MDLPLSQRVVSRVAFTLGGLWLEFWGSPDYTLHIEQAFGLMTSAGTVTVDPQHGPHPAYLAIVGRSIEVAIAAEDGALSLTFHDGARIEIAPGLYEPWQLSAENGFEVVSVTGGGLAVREAQRPKSEPGNNRSDEFRSVRPHPL
jgi:hypothetical protein